jgi:hypothetical protein
LCNSKIIQPIIFKLCTEFIFILAGHPFNQETITHHAFGILLSILILVLNSFEATGIIIAGEGLENLDLCSVLRAFEQAGIFIVPHLYRATPAVTRDLGFSGLIRRTPLRTRKGMLGTYSNPDPHR